MCENFGISGGEGGTFSGLILENPEGREVIWQIPSMGVVWIFSGTIQLEEQRTGAPNDVFLQNTLKTLFRLSRVLFDLIIIIITHLNRTTISVIKTAVNMSTVQKINK